MIAIPQAESNGLEVRKVSAKVVPVIEVEVVKGDGTFENPNRIVTQYWSLDGKLLAESDLLKKEKE